MNENVPAMPPLLLLYAPEGVRDAVAGVVPGDCRVVLVDRLEEAAALAGQVVLVAADTLLEWEPGTASEWQRSLDLPMIALAHDEEQGLEAVRAGAEDWARAGDRADLEAKVATCLARRQLTRPTLLKVPSRDRRRLHRELLLARETGLRAMGMLLEQRDLETKGHTDRVVRLGDELAGVLGLGPLQRQSLRWGAYLHDMGKIALPDSVLLKPGSLSDEEIEQVREHSGIGYRMVSLLPFLPKAAAEVVLHHHERWDGAGYPGHLQGEEIPVLARLFSIVDVYDSLVHDRPYRPAWTPSEAVTAVAEGAGSQFDPSLVEAFLELVNVSGPQGVRGIVTSGSPASGTSSDSDPLSSSERPQASAITS